MFKKVVGSVVLVGLLSSSASALGFVNFDVGGVLGGAAIGDSTVSNFLNTAQQTARTNALALAGGQQGGFKFTYGGYARLWLGGMFRFAPFFKYERTSTYDSTFALGGNAVKNGFSNWQYGGLFGVKVPIIGLTPYIGASYSQFTGIDLKGTYAINYGVKWDIPLLPLVNVGLDASWQRPQSSVDGSYTNINKIMLTLGVEI
ncbi:hypothetical protein BKH43_00635 [Helicobacter sp. 13S00401-1]|uniref:hypothetical protein n=1 Tax=Helicobacter sp. 13S00401-1 TaxID=1905758 RepID=UPI000BA7563C|nr:hypothetical protein [Helicobacter sp. 13S00401-1]PAF51776.1 hypothetical protein BKH43_00635 [Helicobacter sp. 13S00401-1]